MKRRKFIIAGFFVLWVSFLLTASWAATTVKEVEGHIMCMCKDKCGKVLANCTCDTSHQYRMDISLKLKEGLTKEQVIQTYVDRYGEKVLSAPTKKGFNLVAWIAPFFAIMVGGFGIRHVISKWVSMRKKEKQNESILEKEHPKNEKYSDQLDKELKKFD